MGVTTIRKFVLFLGIFCWPGILLADDSPTNYYNNSSLQRTNATVFASQAAIIAGAAQACGQDTREFVQRVNEILYKMSFSSADKVIASATFNQTMQQAQANQMNYLAVPCDQVIAEFQNLPIMHDDYQQTVITQLNPNTGQAVPRFQAPNPAPAPSSIGNNPPPNIITLAPAGVPPLPVPPVDHTAPNILFQSPGIAPTVDTTKPLPNINAIAPNPWTNQNPPTAISNPYAGQTPPP